jgi:hypothetical protein
MGGPRPIHAWEPCMGHEDALYAAREGSPSPFAARFRPAPSRLRSNLKTSGRERIKSTST